jgi:transposase
MLNFAPELRIYLHAGHVDMRKSFDGLFGIVRESFDRDVRDGGLFLFINRRRDRLKLLYWDTDGLAIWMKRLEGGRFQHLAAGSDDDHITLDTAELNMLLSGIELTGIKRRPRYRRRSADPTSSTQAVTSPVEKTRDS